MSAPLFVVLASLSVVGGELTFSADVSLSGMFLSGGFYAIRHVVPET